MAKYFTDAELACKCCGVVGVKPAFVDMLDDLRSRFNRPLIVTSCYRCEKHNLQVGGKLDSQHLLGLAADLHCVDSAERYLLLKLAFEIGFRGIEIVDSWIHVDFRAGMERAFLKS